MTLSVHDFVGEPQPPRERGADDRSDLGMADLTQGIRSDICKASVVLCLGSNQSRERDRHCRDKRVAKSLVMMPLQGLVGYKENKVDCGCLFGLDRHCFSRGGGHYTDDDVGDFDMISSWTIVI